MSWLGRLFHRSRLERELDAEIKCHLDEHIRDLVATGISPAQARRQARMALGGVEQVKEETRDARGTRWLEDLAGDVRFALRTLRKAPGFTLAAVLTLAVGIGANTAVFSVADALFFRSLPVDRPEELFYLQRVGSEGRDLRFSGPALERFRPALPAGTRLAAMSSTIGMNFIADRAAAERASAQLVSGDWFPVQIRWLVIGDSMRLVVAGVVVGLGVAMLSLRAVEGLVFGVSPRDPVSVGAAVVILLAVGLAAAAVPVWRASRVDPVVALRRD